MTLSLRTACQTSSCLLVLVACSPALDFPLEDCNNGRDDDGDGEIDNLDNPDCPVPNERAEGCIDGVDNDGDGLIDIDDPNCWGILGGGIDRSSRVTVRRCSSRVGMSPEVDQTELADAWRLDGAAYQNGALATDSGATQFRAELTPRLTGALIGTKVVGTMIIGGAFQRMTIGLEVDSSEPVGFASPLHLMLQGDTGGVTVTLETAYGRRSSPSMLELPELPTTLIFEVEISGRDDTAIVRIGDASASVSLRRPELPSGTAEVRAPALLFIWSGSDVEDGRISLDALTVSRPRFDPCGTKVPSDVLAGVVEVLSLSSSPDVMCTLGRVDDGGLATFRATTERQDVPAFAPPEWETPVRVGPSHGLGLVGWSGEEGFTVLAGPGDGAGSALEIYTSPDCRRWARVGAMEVRRTTTQAIRAWPVALRMKDEGLMVWMIEERQDEPEEEFLVLCELGSLGDACALSDPEGTNDRTATARSLRPPRTTAIAVGSDLIWVSGARPGEQDLAPSGWLELLDRSGQDPSSHFFAGSTAPGTFDRFLHQGTFWFDPDVKYVRDLVTTRTRWLIYSASQCADCPRRVASAQLSFEL
jgi:hypothetical protein